MRILFSVILVGCGSAAVVEQPQAESLQTQAVVGNPEYAIQWMEAFAENADRLPPTQGTRALAYLAVAMHEITRLSGNEPLPSLAGQLNGLKDLPTPPPGLDWNVALASAMDELGSELFDVSFAKLTQQQVGNAVAGTQAAQFGASVAAAVSAWAKTDGFAESLGKTWTPGTGEQHWAGKPVHPFYGDVSPFALATSDDCRAAKPTAFSTATDSAFYQEAHQTYLARASVTEADREAVYFWKNEGTHWVRVASERLRRDHSRLSRAGKTYALLSVALADSYISSWQDKFRHSLLRPVDYINAYVDAGWAPLSFALAVPEYVSSQAVSSAAAAQIMTVLYGDGPIEDAGRQYPSYWDAALEAAETGVLSGTQFPMSVDAGVTAGVCVGRRLLDRVHI